MGSQMCCTHKMIHINMEINSGIQDNDVEELIKFNDIVYVTQTNYNCRYKIRK